MLLYCFLQLTREMRKRIIRQLTELGAPAADAVAALKRAELARRWHNYDQLLNHLGDELTRPAAAG